MPDLDELYPGRFLKGRTIEKPTVIRIVGVGGEPLEGDDGDKRIKGVLRCRAAGPDGRPVDMEIVWNRTNALLAAAALGTRDYTAWSGKLLTIWFDASVRLGKETPGGIRVYGSPELRAPLRVEVKRPRRKTPEVYNLIPTDNQGRERPRKPEPKPAPAATPPEAAPPPADNHEPGADDQ